MPEGAAEGQPHPAHKLEAKHATGTQLRVDSAATPRQQITESEESKEELRASIMQSRQRIEQLVQESEKLLVDARKFPDISQPTPPKEPQKTGIRGLINRLIGKNNSTEPPTRK